MGITKALVDMINSDTFKEKAKQKNSEGSRYRMFLSRYRKGELGVGIITDLLIENGYEFDINPPMIEETNYNDNRWNDFEVTFFIGFAIAETMKKFKIQSSLIPKEFAEYLLPNLKPTVLKVREDVKRIEMMNSEPSVQECDASKAGLEIPSAGNQKKRATL